MLRSRAGELGRMRLRLVCERPRVQSSGQHSFMEIGFEIISTAILPLPLI